MENIKMPDHLRRYMESTLDETQKVDMDIVSSIINNHYEVAGGEVSPDEYDVEEMAKTYTARWKKIYLAKEKLYKEMDQIHSSLMTIYSLIVENEESLALLQNFDANNPFDLPIHSIRDRIKSWLRINEVKKN